MKKAVAVHTLFIIAVTVIFLFFAIMVFLGWIKIHEDIANPAMCQGKLLDYCYRWSNENYLGKPYNWNTEAPGCVKLNFLEPELEQCKDLLQQE